jgi:predicted  nucleic acid-binding Zn-ribbon protein
MSTFANVYLGAAPNDLTGDTLRHAFEIINTNFANLEAGTAGITVDAPVRSVAGRTGNVLLYVNDVYGAASLANVIAQTTAANTYANTLYATTTSNITANVYAQVAANLASNISSIATGLVVSGDLLAPVNANVTQTNANVAAANVRIQNIEANLGGVNTSVTSLVSANITLNANLGTATTNITNLLANAATQSADILTNTNRVTAANARIATLDANLGTATTNISALLSNAATQANTLDTLLANAAAQSLSLAVLTVNAASQADTLGTLTANTVAQQVTIASLLSNAQVQVAELQSLAANSATQGGQINAIAANLTSATADIIVLQTDVADLQANLAPVGALQSNDAVQATQIRALDANLGLATTNISTGYTETNNLRANITAANAAIITANTGMKSYVDAVTTAWTANAATQAVQIDTISANLGTATTNITTLFANAGAQGTAILATNANITAANVEIDSLRANITAANVQINNLRANITAANTNITTNTNRVTAANVEIDKLRANITAANVLIAPVANLSAIVGNLIPLTSNVYNIGSEQTKWNKIFTGGNIQTISYLLAGQSVQSPLTETGNLTANTTLIYNEAIVGNIRTVDSIGRANLGNIITSSGVFWANGVNYSQSFTTAGNLTFSDTTIGTAGGTTNGIILNSAGAGEIAIQDYTGINNTNPGYWLHIGDGSAGTGDNTGNISIDFRNNTGTQRGSTILGYAWWDSASTGTDNRGTGPHSHFGIYKNDDTFDNKFIEFNYTSGNANVGNITARSLTVLTNVSYTMANYQNWTSNVSTVGGAMDQLAARLKAAGF